jgi:L-threonylcarbamoyladenylate synthase
MPTVRKHLKDFRIKKKTFYNPLIVHIKSIADLDKIATDIPEKAKLLADTFWPGPLTLVLKRQSTIPDLVTAGKIRSLFEYLITRSLSSLEQLSFPLAAQVQIPLVN